MAKKKIFIIYVYGPESDYDEERLDKNFRSLKAAFDWAKGHIPAALAYKVYKFEEVANVPPRRPVYLS